MNAEEKQRIIDEIQYPVNLQFKLEGLVPTGTLVDRIKVFDDVCPNFFKDGKKLLDVGCSKGYFSFLAASNGFEKVVGIDPNVGVIDACRNLGISNVYLLPDTFRNFKIDDQYDRIFVGNGPHHIFADCSGTWDWLGKLAAISSDLVLMEGGFDMSDNQMYSEIRPEWMETFTIDSFMSYAKKFFSIEKFVKSSIEGRYVVLLKRKNNPISKSIQLRKLPVIHTIRLGWNKLSTLFISEYDGKLIFCKIYPITEWVNLYGVSLAGNSGYTAGVLCTIKYDNEIIGWCKELIPNMKCCGPSDALETLKVACKYQIFLLRNGYIDVDFAFENYINDDGVIRSIDHNQVYHIKHSGPSCKWLNALLTQLPNLNIDEIENSFTSNDSYRLEKTFSDILESLNVYQ